MIRVRHNLRLDPGINDDGLGFVLFWDNCGFRCRFISSSKGLERRGLLIIWTMGNHGFLFALKYSFLFRFGNRVHCSVKADLLSVRVEALTQAHRIVLRGEKLRHPRTNSDQDKSVIMLLKWRMPSCLQRLYYNIQVSDLDAGLQSAFLGAIHLRESTSSDRCKQLDDRLGLHGSCHCDMSRGRRSAK